MSQNIEIERRLAAVLAADVAGFSRLTEADEVGTMLMLTAQRAILDNAISRHKGRIANTAGDSVLAEFPSAVNAVQCAVEAQQALRDAAEDAAEDRRVLFRIGIHVGDVMVRGGDLLGSGVNVAARLESLADAGGIVISAAAHEQVKKILPLAYADLGPQQVKNIEEPVRAFAIGSAPAAVTVSVPGDGTPLPLPDKPSIAVLPFQNMSGDPEQEYFADGMVEDIITALSRFKSLFVIARSSSFTYKGKAVDIKQVGRELGVRYVLEGSVRKAGGRVRITGQLIEAATGNHLWADKFDGALEDVFELQDKVTASVVGSIAPAVDRSEIERAKRKPIENLNAYDYLLRGTAYFYGTTREDLQEAMRLFYHAIELDPNFGPAYGMIAWCYNERKIQGWVEDADREKSEARRVAMRAIALADDDAHTLARVGFVLFYSCREEITGKALIEKALTLNENQPRAWSSLGSINLFFGKHEAVIEYCTRSLRLSPMDPRAFAAETNIATALLLLGRPEEAIRWASKALSRHPSYMLALRTLAIAEALQGNLGAARETIAKIREGYPALRLSNYTDYLPYRRPEDIELMLSGLRLAGLPE